MSQDNALHGAIAIVTGGATGIGAATVKALAAEGCAVVVDYVGDEKIAAQKVCAEAERLGARAIAVEGDISTEGGVCAVFDACQAQLGLADILVNSAGVNGQGIHVADMPLEQWQKTLSVNLTGPFLCSREFVRRLRGKNKTGRIVNVSSVHEEIVFKGFADYDSSKAGLLSLTRTLAFEVASIGIRVNAVSPGMVLTSMNEEAQDDPAALEQKTEHIPMRRAATPDDIASIVVFLCKGDSAYITGTSIRADGGLSLNTGQGA